MILMAQFFRIIGSIFSIISDKSNDTKKIFLYNSISNLFCSIQYFLLNAISGGITSIIAILRNIIFYKYKEKVTIKELLMYFLILIIFSIRSINGLVSIIPILLVIIYSTSLYTKNIYTIKYAIIITCLLEIIYDAVYKAYVGIFVCVLDIFLVSISLYKIKKGFFVK